MSSPGATAPRACRLRDGIPVKWPRDDAPGRAAFRPRASPFPPARTPICTPGGRGDGARAAGRAAGIGLREERYATQRAHPEVIARRNRATGAQAARRRPGEVAARRRYW
jgi:hypothetical protein